MAALLLIGLPTITVHFGHLSTLSNAELLIEKPMPGLTTLTG